MTAVKICGITRPEDGLAAAHAGAHAIGLVFHPASPRYVTSERARSIIERLPPFVTAVGLFVDLPAREVENVLAKVPLQLLQFHGDESPDYCSSFDRPYIKAVRVRPEVDLLQCASIFSRARGLLLDAYIHAAHGGTGASFDWALVPPRLPLPVVLAGGLTPENVAAAVRAVRPWAVDVSSGVEREKGIKDAAKMAAFIRGARDADV
ncbi:MAG TPA: phosphoribosylanthranilate isomerase [Burkholderiales bacterium]|nr:phosphoribosylanthranilate isomerase [Burkholderiales bacterium]